ncbi:hypothetical protein V8E52_007576 [Russula decolorans]
MTTYPIPEGGNDTHTAIKNFGDTSAGIATQCMKASKRFNARPQSRPRKAAGMVVDSDVDDHARSNETFIAFW